MDNLVYLWEDAAQQYADNTYRGTRSPSVPINGRRIGM